ncbi:MULTISPECIES: DUF1127 domain-containing protein [unclassified Sulfitobacter]|uniref:DUF1127 domain-containing protein n=1 Tax=unclassified Sulfitobacter TaxID=196795 RepID=UPI0015937DF6|nr:DUF1127 domain-containing protein [Sulfitobacter sp. HGT1]MBQ0805545.1 DUF1127 domain-containing protein [Sulfitobacter sp.]
MAMFYTPTTNYATASTVNRAFSHLGDIVASVIAWNDARVTRNALSSLTDRELDDIGLTRGDIENVALNHFIR